MVLYTGNLSSGYYLSVLSRMISFNPHTATHITIKNPIKHLLNDVVKKSTLPYIGSLSSGHFLSLCFLVISFAPYHN